LAFVLELVWEPVLAELLVLVSGSMSVRVLDR
jgi:hypothetical protein